MSREIKFRALDKRTKVIVQLLGFKYVGKNSIQLFYLDEGGDSTTCTCDKEFIVLLQYTGLKDKNGVEIYEGDIVKATSLFGEVQKLEIFWHEYLNGWGTKNYYIDNSFPEDIRELGFTCSGLMIHRDVEVIGNIHDNHELLEQEESE